jgi:hypothetical protein
MFYNLLTSVKLYKNLHHLSRYIKFITTHSSNKKIKYQTHFHHILPKAKDFFPEYKDLKLHNWNGIHLTAREHYIAHIMLHKAFPGSSQTLAFYNMSNICGKRNSRAYQEARTVHLESLKKLHSNPERNKKIGDYWRGKVRPEMANKLKGHIVTTETREKLRTANLGKAVSNETRDKLSKASSGKVLGPCPDSRKKNISESKKGLRPFNNGIVVKLFKETPPDGWYPGYGNLRKKRINDGL